MERNGDFEMTRFGNDNRQHHGYGFNRHKGAPPRKAGAILDSWTDRSSRSDEDKRARNPGKTKQQNRERSRSRDKTPEVSPFILEFENFKGSWCWKLMITEVGGYYKEFLAKS